MKTSPEIFEIAYGLLKRIDKEDTLSYKPCLKLISPHIEHQRGITLSSPYAIDIVFTREKSGWFFKKEKYYIYFKGFKTEIDRVDYVFGSNIVINIFNRS